jgi:hypothetical protein
MNNTSLLEVPAESEIPKGARLAVADRDPYIFTSEGELKAWSPVRGFCSIAAKDLDGLEDRTDPASYESWARAAGAEVSREVSKRRASTAAVAAP